MLTLANVIWGARCGKSARRVLPGETNSSGHAHSVRGARESAALRQAPHGLPPSRLVSTTLFDLWVQYWRTHRTTGDVIVVRYADDMVLGFQHRGDAERFLQDWRDRLQKFGLELHPDKTRLIEFGRFAAASRKQRGERKPETFNFLGFTHICGQARKNGKFLVLRKSIRKRLLAKLKQVKDELRMRMHHPLAEVGKWLRSVVRGYFNYHAVPGNFASLKSFRLEVSKRWLRVIQRRSQKNRMSWKHMAVFVKQWLPVPKILHPYPYLRFDAKHPR
jgi:RNA-directed DNA polymerase